MSFTLSQLMLRLWGVNHLFEMRLFAGKATSGFRYSIDKRYIRLEIKNRRAIDHISPFHMEHALALNHFYFFQL